MRIIDLVLVTAIVLAGMFLADMRADYPQMLPWLQGDQREHLGAEYDAIAVAIRGERGFSDPFQIATGPTAWMPPALPYFTAGLYWITGDRRAHVVEIIVALQAIVVLFTGLLVVWQARQLGRTTVGYVVLVGGFAANFHELFQKTHDVWLVLLLVDLLWLGALLLSRSTPTRLRAIAWGCVGGIAALASPIVGASWAVITTSIWWPWRSRLGSATLSNSPAKPSETEQSEANTNNNRGVRRGWWPLMLTALVSIVIVTPWTIRNRVILDQWMPIKSNGMYEMWQSQCLDDDGVLDQMTTMQHPWPSAGQQRQRYQDLGEIGFVAEKGEEARASIASQPSDFARRVVNRWAAACIYYAPFNPYVEPPVWPTRYKRLVFPLPLISVLIILMLRPVPLPTEIRAAIAIWCLVLAPYILISYYDRYAAPLVGMKMLLVLYGIDTFLTWRKAR